MGALKKKTDGHISRASIIDYVMTNKKALEEIQKIREGNKTKSDHVPLEEEIERPEKKKEKTKRDRIVIERNDQAKKRTEYHKIRRTRKKRLKRYGRN